MRTEPAIVRLFRYFAAGASSRVGGLAGGMLLLVAALAAGGESLSDSDRQLLLEKLQKLRDAVEGHASSRIGLAVGACRNAMVNNAAALEFYLKCVEKVEFTDQRRKPAEFRDWKRNQGKRLEDPSLGLALRHQLNWLVLTLEAADRPEKVPELAPRAAKALEAIFLDARKLAGQQHTLQQPVLGTPFARAYDVDGLTLGEWPEQPLALGAIFDKVLLPPLRTPSHLTELREAWMRRIRYEKIMREGWSVQEDRSEGNGNGGDNGEGNGVKIGTKDALRSPAYERFVIEEVPNLVWQMEEDLFKAGDQRGAALRMLDQLEKYMNHRHAVEWAKSFVDLVSPKKAVPGLPGGPPSEEGPAPGQPPPKTP